MTPTFRQDHPEYVRIASHIQRARAERALMIGESIGNALATLTHAIQRSRITFALRGERKPA